MRLSVMAAAVVVAFAGCKPPPKNVTIPMMITEVTRYFNNLNNASHGLKDEGRRAQERYEQNPTLPAPAGRMYSTYLWDCKASTAAPYFECGFVVKNYACKTCNEKMILAAPAKEYLCKTCGHSPYKVHPPNTDLRRSPCTLCVGQNGKPAEPAADLVTREAFGRGEGVVVEEMLQPAEETNPEKPLRVKVRYVRYAWVYDERATVRVSPKALEKASVDAKYIPTDGGTGSSRPGYHRQDGVYVGEIEFELRGDQLVVLGAPKEEAVRPWKDIRKR